MNKRVGKNDIILLTVFMLVAVVILGFFFLRKDAKGNQVVISVDGVEFGTYDLSQNATIDITDASGNVTNILHIEHGKAKMTEADCPDKLCMYQNAISLSGENIVCLPNKVVATVINETEDTFDSIAK